MKKNYFHIILFSVLILTGVSCAKQLTEANINPNATENAQPDYLLTGAIKTTADLYWGVTNNMNSSLLFVQQWAKIQYTEEDRFIFSNSSFTSLWSTGYAQSISSFNRIIESPDSLISPNYRGVALVLRSWVFLLLTDAYGDIPYSEAGNIDAYITPSYDAQKDIYPGLLEDLKKAKQILDPSGKAIAGDIIYNGNISQWEKLSNSLRLRIALRIADREPERARQEIDDLKNEGDPFISSNDDIARLIYLTSPQQNPVSASFETRNDYRVSKTLVDKLYELNDPRLPVYASRPDVVTSPEYIGVPNGLSNSDASILGFSKTSRPGDYFRDPGAPAVIFSYAELLFDRAEAAARGFTNEDAGELYLNAIRASLEQYNIPQPSIDDYLSQAAVQFDPANFRKSIGEQKWIALYGQGLEAFAEWRRLDYPELTAPVAGALSGQIPVRFIYPGTEQSLNGKNYKEAVTRQGPDLLTTRLWFDIH